MSGVDNCSGKSFVADLGVRYVLTNLVLKLTSVTIALQMGVQKF
jgi:hypothetical protein